MREIEKVVFMGAGNVATQLGLALRDAGIDILQVYSRTEQSAALLARKLGCSYTTRMEDIIQGADLYIFSVADKALAQLVEEFPNKDSFVVHTSGSIGIEVLQKQELRYGVFYPLQTFSKQVTINFRHIPICLEAQDEIHLKLLKKLAAQISKDVRQVTSEQRATLHVAAVFACNFTNHMFAIADDILQQAGLQADILHPLIEETFRKIKNHKPADVQTGPAVREDYQVMERHVEQLGSLPDYQKIYTFISQSIIATQQKKS